MRAYKFLAIAVMMSAVFVLLPGVSSAQVVTGANLQAQINALLAEVAQLQAQLTAQQGGTGQTWCYTLSTNLSVGMTGADVTGLQTALQKDGESVTVNGTFDDQTAAAVTGFQEKYAMSILTPYGLSNGTGYAGPTTRAKFNSLYGCGSQSQLFAITTPSPLPNGKVSTNSNDYTYTAVLGVLGMPTGYITNTLNGSVSPYSTNTLDWSVSSGALPPGLRLSASDSGEIIVGSPTTAGVYNFSLTVTTASISQMNSSVGFVSNTKQFALTVDPAGSVTQPSASLNLSALAGSYQVGSNYVLQMTSNQPNAPFYLCSNFVAGNGSTVKSHSNQCIASPLTTNASGGYSWNGTWDSSAIGTWTEWVQFGSYTSPSITFTIAQSSVGNQPTVTVLSPNGGEQWQIGSTQTISWNSANNNYVIVDLVRGTNNSLVKNISIGNSATTGRFTWQIPSDVPAGNDYKIRINGTDNVGVYRTNLYAYSDASFSIVSASGKTAPSASLSLTASGGSYQQGSSYVLQMTSNQPNAPFYLCSNFVTGNGSTAKGHSNQCIAAPLTSNANGGYSWNGTWDSSAIGVWTEWVQFGSYVSVPMIFTVAPGATANPVTITAAPSFLSFTATQGGNVTSQPYQLISVVSPDNVLWTTSVPAASTWLPMPIAAGAGIEKYSNGHYTGSATIAVSVNSANLSAGTYKSFVTINGPQNSSPTIIPITLTVVSPGTAQPSASLSLTASGGSYQQGSSYVLQMSSNQPNAAFQLCSNFAPANGGSATVGHQGQCAAPQTANSSGGYSWNGTWDSSAIGTWTEWVQFGSYTSPSITFTVAVVPPQTVQPSASLNLTASGGSYQQGSSYVLQMTSNQPNAPFYLCSNFVTGNGSTAKGHSNQCIAAPLTSNANGGYSWNGTWDSSAIGVWTEWVQFGSYVSPGISFAVSAIPPPPSPPPAPSSPTLSVSGSAAQSVQGMTTFPYGAAWQLHLVSGPANTTFSFCGKHDSAAVVCAPSFGTTDANGIWNSSGAFTGSSAPGFWLEWIQFPDGTNSNQVSFTVSQPVTTSQAQNLSQTADILQAMQGILQALSKLAQ